MNILVSRTDKAGDLILTMPVFRELKRAFPNAHISALVTSYTASLASLCPEIDQIIKINSSSSLKDSINQASLLKRLAFDQAFIVHPSFKALFISWLANIPLRVGRASNIWQFLLTNKKRQKRSKNEKHEFEYNLDLLSGFVKDIDYSPYKIKPRDNLKIAGKKLFNSFSFKSSPVIIHPGSGGSAFNLPTANYVKIAQMLLDNNIPLIISLGPSEKYLISYFPRAENGKIVYLTDTKDFSELASIFVYAKAFIGGSTGPLHLAAALDLACLAFFPPVFAMTPKRWGPLSQQKLVLMPPVEQCQKKCNACSWYPCMEKIDLALGVDWIKSYFFSN